MKTKYYIFQLITCLALLCSCTAEDNTEIPGGSSGKSSEAEVAFNLSVPAQQYPTTTRAITDDAAIKNIRIWMFKGTGNDATFVKQIKQGDKDSKGNPLIKLVQVGATQKLFVLLPESPEKVTLSMIVNVPESTPAPAVDTKKTEALQGLEYNIDVADMPMYAETEITVQQGATASVPLRRAMAKVEVDARDAFSLLKLESVKLLNINTKGNVAIGSIGSTGENKSQLINATKKEENICTFYIPEIADIKNKKVSVLIKGKYKDGASSYYRLEFIGREGNEVENIERNNKYVFLISNVSTAGHSTEESAINGPAGNASPGSGMTLQVIENEDIMDITTDGNYFLGVTSASITAGENDICYFANFSVQGNNPQGWKMITTEFGEGVTVSMDLFTPAGDVTKVNSVWIYIEKNTAMATSGNKIDVYVYSGGIRKKIVVTIP